MPASKLLASKNLSLTGLLDKIIFAFFKLKISKFFNEISKSLILKFGKERPIA